MRDNDSRTLASRPRALTWLRVAFAVALLGPICLLGYVGWSTYHEAIASARERLIRLAQIAQEQSQRVLETNEVISRGIETRIGTRSNAELRSGGLELHTVLKAWTWDLKQVQSVWVWDESGHAVATNLRPDPRPGSTSATASTSSLRATRPRAAGM